MSEADARRGLSAPKGDTRPDSSQPALAEFRRLAESQVFDVTI